MRRRIDGKRRKSSKIQDPALEHPRTLKLGIMESLQSGYCYCWKLRIFHQGRTGLPIVISVLDPRSFWDYIYEMRGMRMESYLQETFGAGTFEVGLYDENDIERGKYRYHIGGADKYIHPSEYVNQDLEDSKDMVKLASTMRDIMEPNREFHKDLLQRYLVALSRR